MGSARFDIIGPPRLSINGQAVRLHSAKATALLAYLVCRPGFAYSRDGLATLFWGESPDARARQSLRQALYSLRRALGELAAQCLVVDARTVTYCRQNDFVVDITEFDRLVQADDAASLRQAVGLHRGPVLASLDIAGAPEFETWLRTERGRVQQALMRARHTLIERHLAAGELGSAVRHGKAILALDMLDEKAHRQLMRAYFAQGDLAAVRRQYDHCRTLLREELAVEPAAETTALIEQLATAQSPEATGRPLLPPVPPPSFPYQGCTAELDQLAKCWRRALRGQMALVLIGGEAGGGKTELVQEFRRRLTRQKPVQWLQGRNYESEGQMPYTMWADALAPLARPEGQKALSGLPVVWREQLGRLAPGLASETRTGIGMTEAENHLRLLQGVVQGVIHLTHHGPLVLFFDDLQWCDAPSLALLHYAARQLRSHPVLLLGAFRPESVTEQQDSHAFWHTSNFPRIDLSPLRPADIASLLAHLGWPAGPATVDRLYRHCQGNRLMLVETLRLLQESEQVDLLQAATPLPVPRRVRDLIQARLARVGSPARQTLAAAAVIGRPVDLTLLGQVSGQSEPKLLAEVDRLMARSLLSEGAGGDTGEMIAFRHNYVRQVAYATLRPGRRRALHRRTAEALATGPQLSPLEAEEVARHFEMAGDVRAITFLLQAAAQAAALHALPQATGLLTRALVFQARHRPDDLAQRFDILLTRETHHSLQGLRQAQAEDIAELLTLAATMNEPGRRAQGLIRQAGYYSDTAHPAESRVAAEAALALYREAGDTPGEARAMRELGYLYWSRGEYGLALSYGREALHRHRQLGDLEGEATALHNLGEIHRGLSSPRQALTYYQQAQRLHWARRDARRQGLTGYGLAHALRQLGRRDEALAAYRQTLEQTRQAGDRVMASRVYHEMAALEAESGDLALAGRHMAEAVRLSRKAGYLSGLAASLIGLGFLYARQRQSEAARAALLEARSWLELTEDQANQQLAVDYLRQLDEGRTNLTEPTTAAGWVKTHVNLEEGKVYCEYESPLALLSRAGLEPE